MLQSTRNRLSQMLSNFSPLCLPVLRCCEVVQQLYTLLLQLFGFERDSAHLGLIRQAMSELAAACGKLSFDELAEAHGPAVMEAACSGAET